MYILYAFGWFLHWRHVALGSVQYTHSTVTANVPLLYCWMDLWVGGEVNEGTLSFYTQCTVAQAASLLYIENSRLIFPLIRTLLPNTLLHTRYCCCCFFPSARQETKKTEMGMGMRDRRETGTEGGWGRRKPGDTEMWGRWKISWKSNSNGWKMWDCQGLPPLRKRNVSLFI